MTTTEKTLGHLLGYGMVAGGMLMSIIGGTVMVKMLAKEDNDKEAIIGAVGLFIVGTAGIYIGNRIVPNDEK